MIIAVWHMHVFHGRTPAQPSPFSMEDGNFKLDIFLLMCYNTHARVHLPCKRLIGSYLKMLPAKHTALSLFSSAGIGELGLRACGYNILLSNELLEDRCALYKENFPDTDVLCGDIWKLRKTVEEQWEKYNVGSPFLLYATPPCQGMSFNGIGKILSEIRAGRRPKEDARNRLIIPTVEIIKTLRPQWVLLENVPTMKNTVIRTEDNQYRKILDYLFNELEDEYVGRAEEVNCADFGIPQTRIRLITILTRTDAGKRHFAKHGTFIPQRTHSEQAVEGTLPWVTLRQAIGDLPHLSATRGHNQDPKTHWHVVPIVKPEKYWWLENTPSNETAYNNQCSECGCTETPRHGMCMIGGRHQSKKDTPIYCVNCGALLPRPTMIDKSTGKRRLIKGFDSAYRRMAWDVPAPTLTQNFQFESSDKKLHPSQNRTLSIYEGLCIQTITDFPYKLAVNGKDISRNLCCQIIGESVPPKLIEILCENIAAIEKPEDQGAGAPKMVSLFSGIGGFELGFATAGVETALMCEIDDVAARVLRSRLPEIPLVRDIRELKEIPDGTDVLCAGFPCQDLSSAGIKRGLSGARSSLVKEVFRLITKRKPEWVLFENVSFMRSLNGGETLWYIIESLEKHGYKWAYRTIDSLAFLPQHRCRIYIMASLNHDPRAVILSGDEPECLKEVNFDSFEAPLGFYWTEGRFSLGLVRNGIPTLKAGSTIGIPSPPAIAFPSGEISMPDIRDAERLQGFPAGWTEAATEIAKESDRWKLVGNAVTVNAVAWIANKMKHPEAYDSTGDAPLVKKCKLPKAAWGINGERFCSGVSEYPVPTRQFPLEDFLKYPRKELSVKAAAGFKSRMSRGNIKHPSYFYAAIQNFINNKTIYA